MANGYSMNFDEPLAGGYSPTAEYRGASAYGGYKGGVSLQPESLSQPNGPQLQPHSYDRGGLDTLQLDNTNALASRDRVMGSGYGDYGGDAGETTWQKVGGAAQAIDAGVNAVSSLTGGQGEQPGQQNYPSGRPQRPHPAATAKATGDAMSDTGSALLMAAPMTGGAAPYMAVAGLASKGVGAGFQLYAAMKNADQAKEEYEALLDEWEKMKARENEDYKREVERQRQSDIMGKSAYSAAVADRFSSAYGGYRQGGQING